MNGHSAHAPARLSFRVLGPLEVDGPDGHPLDVCGGKPATVLTPLVAEPAPGRFVLLPVVRDHAHRLLLATESHASQAELVA